MLKLTRRVNERLFIGENAEIKITILGVNGKQVKLGIDAPVEIDVNREEIYERIKTERGQ